VPTLHDGLQFSPEASVEFHVNTAPTAETYLLVPEVIPRIPVDCDANCEGDCAATCTKSCVEYVSATGNSTPSFCELANLSGECDKTACNTTVGLYKLNPVDP
jgi:hypothetical protein